MRGGIEEGRVATRPYRRVACGVLAVLFAFGSCGGPDEGPRTVVLLTIDTLRRDRVGAHVPERAPSRTPRLDALATKARVYDDARTPVPLTLPAHATMFTGLPPAATGVRLNSSGRLPPPGPRPYPLLAERLRASGWRTAAFVSATPLARRYGLDQGFETYDDGDLDDAGGLGFARRAGAATVDVALAHVRSLPRDARVFLWVHLFDPHGPYGPYTDYDGAVAAADAAAGRLLDGLEAAGRGDAAMLVTADHGEALDEHGEATHGLLLGDAVLRVPFLLRAPGAAPGRRAGPVDLADVAPTLAHAAGIAWPAAGADGPGTGRDLLAADPSRDRLRVAESLYPHNRFRWAQLAAVVASDGRMLVELGGGRTRLFLPALPGEPQETPPVVQDPRNLDTMTTAIGAYKAMERRDLVGPGESPGGYSSAGNAVPFLSPTENGVLPDPYAKIPVALVIDQRKAAVEGRLLPPARVADGLREMAVADPSNPEIAFWVARALELAGDLPGAEAAYAEAWRVGHRVRGTLLRWVGVNAVGREAQALDRLLARVGDVGWDCKLRLLQTDLLHALGRQADAREAFAQAERECRSEKEKALLEKRRK